MINCYVTRYLTHQYPHLRSCSVKCDVKMILNGAEIVTATSVARYSESQNDET
jgi:hypothetical protein